MYLPFCYNDVYDGNVWKDFLEYQGKPFLSLPFNFAFQLNTDCMVPPFKHTQHAEGADYLTILNLPREECYLYIILLGVIPGPKEPSLLVNTILQPFVKILSLWTGMVLTTAQGLQVLGEHYSVVVVTYQRWQEKCVVLLHIQHFESVQSACFHFHQLHLEKRLTILYQCGSFTVDSQYC